MSPCSLFGFSLGWPSPPPPEPPEESPGPVPCGHWQGQSPPPPEKWGGTSPHHGGHLLLVTCSPLAQGWTLRVPDVSSGRWARPGPARPQGLLAPRGPCAREVPGTAVPTCPAALRSGCGTRSRPRGPCSKACTLPAWVWTLSLHSLSPGGSTFSSDSPQLLPPCSSAQSLASGVLFWAAGPRSTRRRAAAPCRQQCGMWCPEPSSDPRSPNALMLWSRWRRG